MHPKTNTYTSERIQRREAEQKTARRRELIEAGGAWLGLIIFIACILTVGAIDQEVMLYLNQ